MADELKPDPVRVCESYRDRGCSHVDGFLCDPRDCTILADYRADAIAAWNQRTEARNG